MFQVEARKNFGGCIFPPVTPLFPCAPLGARTPRLAQESPAAPSLPRRRWPASSECLVALRFANSYAPLFLQLSDPATTVILSVAKGLNRAPCKHSPLMTTQSARDVAEHYKFPFCASASRNSDARHDSAMIVNVGFLSGLVTSEEPSVTKRFFTSCAWQ